MPLLNRTPEKYEAKALEYERKGKPMKSQKYREKALRLRGNVYPQTQLGQQSTLLSQQQGLPLQQGLLHQQGLPLQQGLLQQQGLPLQQGLLHQQGLPLGQQGLLSQQQGLPLQQGLLHQQGLPLGQQGLLSQQQGLPLGQQGFNQWQGWQSTRNPAIYETNALKWEQRGNWTKAQKNREKFWRLQNPQYSSFAAPTFYSNNKFLGYNQPYGAAFQGQQQLGGLPTLQKNTAITNAPIVEQIVRPTIVQETLRPERIVEVQPIVHREIDAPQVRVIEKHLYETVPSAGPSTITNAPIIQETVRPKIIEEVQPVVHREVPAPFVERVEQHVTEHIVQPTLTTKEVINGGAVHQPFVAAGGAPIQQTTTTTTTTQGGLMGKVNNALHRN